MISRQLDLLGGPPMPEGFSYRPDLITAGEEERLLAGVERLPFERFRFQGYEGKRRVVSFGWRYDFNERILHRTEDLPEFLISLRVEAARFAGVAAVGLQQALVTEYEPGAAIGWHRDKDVFGDVVGVSLRSPCLFRLRRKRGRGWERAALTVEPRSIYLLRGPSRTEWEHSIPAVDSLRYSITFRNVLDPPPPVRSG